jgi:hypothetical protein
MRPGPRRKSLRFLAVALWLSPTAVALLGAPGGMPLDPVPTLVVFTPVSVEVDPVDQSLWVVDQYAARVVHFASDGSPAAAIPASRYGGGRPAGITLAGATGELFLVSDPDSSRIMRIDRSGNPSGSFSTLPFGIDAPADLAWDAAAGAVWVADPPGARILQLRPRDSDGNGVIDTADLTASFSTLPFGSDYPMGVALDDSNGHLFLSDPALDGVLEVTAAGGWVASFDTGLYGGTSVAGLAWDSSAGVLRLADAGRKILAMTPAGGFVSSFGTAPFGSLSPQGIAWDSASGTWVAVTGERKMIRFQPDGTDGGGGFAGILVWRQEWTSSFGVLAPSGIAIDPATGDRFVADSQQHRIVRADAFGAAVTSFDVGPMGSISPTGLATTPGGGSLFLSDDAARKIFEVTPAGTLLSSFSTSPFKKKPHSEPPCDNPVGVAYDATLDHLFIADSQAARVFEVTRAGTFVASFPTAPGAPNPTDLAVDPAGDRLVVSDSSGRMAEFSRSGTPRGSYPPVPLRVRIPGATDVAVDRGTLRRIVSDPVLDAVVFVSRGGAALGQISLTPYGVRSLSGAAWDGAGNRLYAVDSSGGTPLSVSPGPDGAFGTADDSVDSISTAAYGSSAPRGVALDDAGRVGWGDAASAHLNWVTTSLSYLGSVDLSPAGAANIRGVDVDPTSRDLFLTDSFPGIRITSSSGSLVQALSASDHGIGDPGGVGLSTAEGALLVVDLSDRTLVPVDLHPFFLPEVQGVSVSESGEIAWSTQPVFSRYQVLRGRLSDLLLGGIGSCFWAGFQPPALEESVPEFDDGWFYLVAGANNTGVGSLGTRSDGSSRSPSGSTPACP